MADSKSFVCVNEKTIFLRWIRKPMLGTAKQPPWPSFRYLRPWGRIVELYSKAVERGHWKAMHNLANLYRTGWPGGVEKDTQKALDLYQKMIDLKIPQGFYNMGQ